MNKKQVVFVLFVLVLLGSFLVVAGGEKVTDCSGFFGSMVCFIFGKEETLAVADNAKD